MRSALFAGLLALCCALPCQAVDSSALINEELDKPVTIEVNGVLPQVMKKITDQTGVPIDVPQHVYDLLPWGEQTNIRATIKNQTLRQALTALTRKLGLNWELGPQAVKLAPRIPLERLGRRATMQELQLMEFLDNTPFDKPGHAFTVDAIVTAVDQKLAELKSPYIIEARLSEKVKSDQAVTVPRNATLNDALKELTKQTELTWYPWGTNIVIVPKEAQISRQLDRKISCRFNGAELGQVLTELSQDAAVEFSMEPGALQRVPPDFRRITLILDNARIREALEHIRGVTGLDYVVKPASVYFFNQNTPTPAAPAAPSPVLATLQLDAGLSIFLRANDLPPDIQQYVEHKKQEEFKRLRKKMKDEHFVPTTQAAAP
jgi:hypothetical protein